jgi:hypothetical protein
MDVPPGIFRFLVPDCQSNCHGFIQSKIEMSLLGVIGLPELAGFQRK